MAHIIAHAARRNGASLDHASRGVAYHHLVGAATDAARLGTAFVEQLPDDRVV